MPDGTITRSNIAKALGLVPVIPGNDGVVSFIPVGVPKPILNTLVGGAVTLAEA